ncbi:MAG: adenylate/guanylate cyclase domain-containing protein [Geminicoccaceae bacterium]
MGLAGLIALAATQLPFITTIENFLRDLRIAYLTPPLPQHPDIVLVELTEDTLDTFVCRSPPDRAFIAGLVDRMGTAGARILGIDIILNRPTEPVLDKQLKDSLEQASMPVIIATATPKVADIGENDEAVQRAFAAHSIQGDAVMIRDPIDGYVRRHIPHPDDDSGLLTFSGALARAVGRQLPEGEITIAYRVAKPGMSAFRSYPAHQVTYLPDDWFRDKIVLIGGNLPDIDRYLTPLSRADNGNATAGMVVQAHMLAQLLDHRSLPDSGRWGTVIVTGLAAMAGIGIASLSIPLVAKAVLLLGTMAGYWVMAFWIFALGGPLLAIVVPSLAMAAANALHEALEGGTARRERRFIRDAFQHFVAPAVVRQLIEDPGRLKLGGERREISTIFTDIAGFTSLTERLEPERMNALLNDYLDAMLQVILDHDGTIDKVVGDALHCFFGAPGEQSDHAQRAFDCALALDRTSEELRRRIEARGGVWGVTRIGVHSGMVLVGNFGGRLRFNYTAHGDAVNTAARLEGANKYLRTRVCISGTTIDGCNQALVRPSADLLPVGKAIPVAVFEPVQENNAALHDYMRAYECMERDKMDEARSILERLAAQHPDDGLVAMHLERIGKGGHGVLIRLDSK